jgi:hypothetical protein
VCLVIWVLRLRALMLCKAFWSRGKGILVLVYQDKMHGMTWFSGCSRWHFLFL